MLSTDKWNQIYPDVQGLNNSFIPNLHMLKLIQLLVSVGYYNQFISVPKWSH